MTEGTDLLAWDFQNSKVQMKTEEDRPSTSDCIHVINKVILKEDESSTWNFQHTMGWIKAEVGAESSTMDCKEYSDDMNIIVGEDPSPEDTCGPKDWVKIKVEAKPSEKNCSDSIHPFKDKDGEESSIVAHQDFIEQVKSEEGEEIPGTETRGLTSLSTQEVKEEPFSCGSQESVEGLILEGPAAETNGITLRIQISAKWPLGSDIQLKLTFHLPVNYPTCPPRISVTSEDLTRAQCEGIQGKLFERAQELLCEPMVHELVLWIQGNLGHVISQLNPPICDFKATVPSGMPEDGAWTVLLQLDHMRAKTKYVKTVENWASDLSLTGRLMFMGRLILILLQGDKENIKDYLILQKTSKVDVDSSGKKCKEKMSTVLYEAKIPSGQPRFLEFQVKEYPSLDDLQKEFVAVKLGNTFTDLILTQFR